MKYLVGRRNLACTIFVPFDCDNNCPFCTSKKMYKDIELNPDKIIEQVKKINNNYDVTEIVLTGGEPFANLDETKKIISAMDKKVFINTTLPMVENIDDVIDYINYEQKIRGLNISRHIGHDFSGVASIEVIDRIKKPIRINTVINKNFSFDKFKEFVAKWGNETRMINLRADYTKLDTTSLKARDEIETLLIEEYTYTGSGGCLVCHSSGFQADNCFIQYHRGLMFSAVKFNKKIYVNDVIITPDGNIYKDWDFVTDYEFNHWIFKEPDTEATEIMVKVIDNETHYQNVLFYAGTDKEKINLTVYIERSVPLYNKSQIEETVETLKKQLKESLVSIETI